MDILCMKIMYFVWADKGFNRAMYAIPYVCHTIKRQEVAIALWLGSYRIVE